MADERKAPPAQVMPVDMHLAEHARNSWCVDVEAGIPPERLLEVDYWAHVTATPKTSIKPWDRIEARSKDGSWYAEFLVLESGRTWARLFPLRMDNLTTGDVAESQAAMEEQIAEAMKRFTVTHRGPRGWSILRGKEIIKEEIGTRDTATAQLRDYVKENYASIVASAQA